MVKPRLKLINNVERLTLTIEVLTRNVEYFQQGKRFGHFTNGHESYVELVTTELEQAERRLKILKG
ncbi:UNVERIFIED_ORG: hypothetical protein M2414_004181 [Rahnella aquatilis]